jgi:hypothetical protein
MSRIVDEFVEHFAGITDADERAKLLSQVKLRAMNQAPKEAFEPPIRTLGKYLSDEIEVPPTLVEPYIVVRGGLTCTIGRAGKGKTVMNLNRLLKWAAGKPMFDGWHDADGNDLLAPPQPLKTLIIENEGAGGLFHRQIGIMLHAEDYMSQADRELAKENILIWGDGGYSGLKLDDPKKLAEVRRGCELWKPDIVFVEPFRGLWNGEENSSTDMAVVVDALVEIAADYQCGVMLAHHERKGGTGEDGEKMSAGRGSTVLEGAVTVMENFESAKGGDARELTWSKSRHGKAPNPVRMTWDPEAWWYKWVPVEDLDEAFVDALRGNADEPMTLKELSEELGEPVTKLRKIADRVVKDGKVGKLPSLSTQNGSTGARFRLASSENQSYGGLSI